MNLEKCCQCSVSNEISLDLKVCFSLVTCKIYNLIALRSPNQIVEIFPPWWLRNIKFFSSGNTRKEKKLKARFLCSHMYQIGFSFSQSLKQASSNQLSLNVVRFLICNVEATRYKLSDIWHPMQCIVIAHFGQICK